MLERGQAMIMVMLLGGPAENVHMQTQLRPEFWDIA
jgi:hypothetical protein